MLKRTACVLAIGLLASCNSSTPTGEDNRAPNVAPVESTKSDRGGAIDRGDREEAPAAEPAMAAKPSASGSAPPPPKVAPRGDVAKDSFGVVGGAKGGGGEGARGPGVAGIGGKARPSRTKKTSGGRVAPAEAPMVDKDAAKPLDIAKPPPELPQSGQLTAGEWRDLDHWDFWRGLFDGDQGRQVGAWKHTEDMWGYRTARRIPVRVEASGVPAVDAKVKLLDAQNRTVWQARTNNKGNAQLFAGLLSNYPGPYKVVAEFGGVKAESKAVPVKGSAPVVLNVAAQAQTANGLDLMFVVDTTGSMGDELSYLQSELRDVVRRVQNKGGQNIDIRTSVNFYRDTTDEYLVRSFPFTRNVDESVKHIEAQSAGGGGDFPEAVEQGLADAVFKHKWRDSARARILFLVLDAPPHRDPEHLAKLHEATQDAARQGIRIVPIVGSGINKETEFLMRFLAVSTDGTYVFLTDDSGIGGSHAKPTIGPHTVEYLTPLLVKIINRQLAVEDVRPVRRAP